MASKLQVGKNIKVLAQGFNPPIFNEYWLKKEKFIPEDLEILPNSISTPQFVQLFTKKFNFIVLPDQFQFNIITDHKLGTDFIRNLVDKIPSLSYNAMGFNFDYLVPEQEVKKGLFFVPANKLYQEFKVSSAKYGGFLTKDYIDSRLSLSVKPTKAVNPKGEESDYFHYSYNFHFQLASKKPEEVIISAIGKWSDYFKYSEKLMTL